MSGEDCDRHLAHVATRVHETFGVQLPMAMALAHRFGSIEAIRQASAEELTEIDKLGAETIAIIRSDRE